MSMVDLRDPIRKASIRGPYLKLEFPEDFRIDTMEKDGTWTGRGPFRRERVEDNGHGFYAAVSDHSLHFIQCVADHGDFFVHVSSGGAGIIRYCRIVDLTISS